MIRVLFLVQSLHQGGAERQLVTLLQGLDKKSFHPVVVTYYPGGKWERDVEEIPGVDLYSIGLGSRFDFAGMILRLGKLIRKIQPDIVYGLLGDACLLALLHGRLLGRGKVVWGLRASNMDFSRYSRTSGWVYRLSAKLSRYADRIISNSRAGLQYHQRRGYYPGRMVVIPNGIDVNYFRPCPEKGGALREELGVDASMPIIGRVGRLDPMKDYRTFLAAAGIIAQKTEGLRFLVAGGGAAENVQEMQALSRDLGLAHRIVWLGAREDLPTIYSACSFTVSSSAFGEGFPNVVAESLSCGVPCVATDVGDSAMIIDNKDCIVPPENPEALANGWERMLNLSAGERTKLGKAGRQRIIDHFSQSVMVEATENIFRDMMPLNDGGG
ncbi:MAG: glycosyltransferase [Deltaproteobacteria bacterium]|nr:glycosyltransferase [Deltaproteobacteria bacterium]